MRETHLDRSRTGVGSPSSPGLTSRIMSTHLHASISHCSSRLSRVPLARPGVGQEREQRQAGGQLAFPSPPSPFLHAVPRFLSHAARTVRREEPLCCGELCGARSAVKEGQNHDRAPQQAVQTEGPEEERRR